MIYTMNCTTFVCMVIKCALFNHENASQLSLLTKAAIYFIESWKISRGPYEHNIKKVTRQLINTKSSCEFILAFFYPKFLVYWLWNYKKKIFVCNKLRKRSFLLLNTLWNYCIRQFYFSYNCKSKRNGKILCYL